MTQKGQISALSEYRHVIYQKKGVASPVYEKVTAPCDIAK